MDVRYEDLVADPVGVIKGIYQKLNLGDFSQVREVLEAYVRNQPPYETNRHQLSPDVSAEILLRWRRYFEHYGYSGDEG